MDDVSLGSAVSEVTLVFVPLLMRRRADRPENWMFRLSHRIPRRFLNPCMPYDAYERHSVVSGMLHDEVGDCLTGFSTWDVGGRAAVLGRFSSYRVLSVKPDGSGHLVASGFALPLAVSSFSAVVSIDTLAHMQRESIARCAIPYAEANQKFRRRCQLCRTSPRRSGSAPFACSTGAGVCRVVILAR